MGHTGPRRAFHRLVWLVPVGLVAVIAVLAMREGPLLGELTPLDQLREGVHPRMPQRLGIEESGFRASGAIAVVAIEPERCDEVCQAQRRALRTLARTTLRNGLVLRVSGGSGLSAWLEADEPMVLAVTKDNRLAVAIHRAADLTQLRGAVRKALSHPSGIPASWPR